MVSDEVIQIVTVLLLQIVCVPRDLLRAVFINESFTEQFLSKMFVIIIISKYWRIVIMV